MTDLVLRGGNVVDGSGTRTADVAVGGGQILAVGEGLDGALVLDAAGCYVGPGLVDLHTHLRQPGREEAESIETASRGAALGGYTAVLAMPDTTPAVDCAAVVREITELSKTALCDVKVAGAITVGGAGEQLAPMGEMAALGVKMFTDSGCGVQDGRLLRRALDYASGLNVTLAQHADDASMSVGGHMHEGPVSSMLGIPGIPAEAEEIMVMRDVALSRLTNGRIHFQHLSTAGSIGIVRAAKASGLRITAEATPHHFTLTDEAIGDYDPVFKVDPPLRPLGDVDAVKAGLCEGVIDAIATDHSPHEAHMKELPFDEAPGGVLGLETAMALAMNELSMPIWQVFEAMSSRPAEIAGISDTHGGPISPGRPANLVVVDPTATWVVHGPAMASRSSNTPYEGRTLTGRVRHTVLRGEAVVVDGEAQR